MKLNDLILKVEFTVHILVIHGGHNETNPVDHTLSIWEKKEFTKKIVFFWKKKECGKQASRHEIRAHPTKITVSIYKEEARGKYFLQSHGKNLNWIVIFHWNHAQDYL